jgi:hypothetical protein
MTILMVILEVGSRQSQPWQCSCNSSSRDTARGIRRGGRGRGLHYNATFPSVFSYLRSAPCGISARGRPAPASGVRFRTGRHRSGPCRNPDGGRPANPGGPRRGPRAVRLVPVGDLPGVASDRAADAHQDRVRRRAADPPGAGAGRHADAVDVLTLVACGRCGPRRELRRHRARHPLPAGHDAAPRRVPVVPLRLRDRRVHAADRRRIAQQPGRRGPSQQPDCLYLHPPVEGGPRHLRDGPGGSPDGSAVAPGVGHLGGDGLVPRRPRTAGHRGAGHELRDLPLARERRDRREDGDHRARRAPGVLAGGNLQPGRPVDLRPRQFESEVPRLLRRDVGGAEWRPLLDERGRHLGLRPVARRPAVGGRHGHGTWAAELRIVRRAHRPGAPGDAAAARDDLVGRLAPEGRRGRVHVRRRADVQRRLLARCPTGRVDRWTSSEPAGRTPSRCPTRRSSAGRSFDGLGIPACCTARRRSSKGRARCSSTCTAARRCASGRAVSGAATTSATSWASPSSIRTSAARPASGARSNRPTT